MSAPERLVDSARLVTCVGPGGVGKTTVAAALALGAARRGRRALVLTIDPARRLADALGAGPLGDEPQEVGAGVRERLAIPAGGALYAMMLDRKRTFDALVHRFSPDARTERTILENPIYQHVSDALAGSAEYSAMEKVAELADAGGFDVIVLDTPPAQHALDFLDAPARLTGFLDSRLVHLLVHPAMRAGRLGMRIFQRGLHPIFQAIERVTGLAFLEDLSGFLLATESIADAVRRRAREVEQLVFGPESAFVLVAGALPESAVHAARFLDHLEDRRVRVAGLVANRVRLWPGGAPVPALRPDDPQALGALERALAASPGAALPARRAAEAALALVAGYAAAVATDEATIAPLRARIEGPGGFARLVPELPRDVHDLDGLRAVASHLFVGGDDDTRGREQPT